MRVGCYRWFVLCLLLVTPTVAAGQQTPDGALRAFTVAAGLKLDLFASEPMFVNPTCIDVDHLGRVWVCESVNYRCDLRKQKRNRAQGDRIVILQDTNGDGTADRATTFFQEKDFIAPLGVAVEPLPGPHAAAVRVYVCHSPHLYVFEDRDGDGKADGPPKILLTGFGGYDHDHGIHGVHFGPEGKLYFSVGDQGVKNLKDKNGKVWSTNQTDCRAGTIWRCNTDGSGLELVAHNFRNQYEPAVNSFGTIFTSDNDDDGNQQTRICYVMPGGNYGYWPRGKGESHWHEEQPGVVHKVLRTGFGSPTGMCWYEGSLLAPIFAEHLRGMGQSGPYEGYLLHTDAGPREVRLFGVRPKGAGYELDKVNLVTSTDNWFRPSDVCVAPDGSVFISDWYDPGVGGHGMGDTTRGRIYRLTLTKGPMPPAPTLDLASDAGLAAALRSPNLAARHGAFQALRARPEADLIAWADRFAAQDSDLLASAREGWLRSHTRSFEQVLVKTYLPLLEKSDAEFTRTSERVVAAPMDQAPSPLVLMERILSDVSGGLDRAEPTVKRFYRRLAERLDHAPSSRELLLALRHAPAAEVKDWLPPLIQRFDGRDHFYLAALNIACGADPQRRAVILADFDKLFPAWDDRVAALVRELQPPSVMATLDRKLADPHRTPAQKAQILEILTVSDARAGERVLAILQQPDLAPELRDQAVQGLVSFLPTKWRELRNHADLVRVVKQMLKHPATQRQAIDVIVASESVALAEHLVDLANDDEAALDPRRQAIAALGAFKNDKFITDLAGLLDQQSLQGEVIQALGVNGRPKAVDLLEEVLRSEQRSAASRRQAVAALASCRLGAQRLLQMNHRQALPPFVLADVAFYLRNSPHQDLRNQALLAFPIAAKMDPNKLPAIADLVARKGDPEHGKAVFATKDIGCVRCHAVQGVGGNVGPDLSMIGVKASRENLLESILFPDKAIADQFVQWVVLDQRGLVTSGVLVEETPEHVVLRDGFGKDHKIAVKDIEQRTKSPKSVMPSDILPLMNDQDLMDLVTYLETLKTPAWSPAAWQYLGPFAAASDAALDAALPAERDERPHGEYPGKAGPIRWQTLRPDGTGYVDLRAAAGTDANQSLALLRTVITSAKEQPATILLGTDDGVEVILNGTRIFGHRRHEAATPHRDRIPVTLRRGANVLVLKINNGDGPHGFYFTLLTPEPLQPAP